MTQAREVQDVSERVALAREDLDEALDVLADVLGQACADDLGTLDSCALSAYARGLRFLARHHRVTITHEYGRRVIATPSAAS